MSSAWSCLPGRGAPTSRATRCAAMPRRRPQQGQGQGEQEERQRRRAATTRPPLALAHLEKMFCAAPTSTAAYSGVMPRAARDGSRGPLNSTRAKKMMPGGGGGGGRG